MWQVKRRIRNHPELSADDLFNDFTANVTREWPTLKGEWGHARRTGEGTITVELDPVNRVVKTATSGNLSHSRKFTNEEKYFIAAHGIAPDGFRLRFVDSLKNNNELPWDQVPFSNGDNYVKGMTEEQLNYVLYSVSTLVSARAGDYSDVGLMIAVDKYEAALRELASRGVAPAPSPGPGPPIPTPPAPPAAADSPTVPEPLAEREPPPLSAPRDEAERAEMQRIQKAVETYVEALEKRAAKDDITSAARALIAERIRQLRVMQNRNLLKPGAGGAPPSPPR